MRRSRPRMTGWRKRARWAVVAVAVGLAAGCARAPRGDPDRPNLVLILLDTVRADRLGCYGYARDGQSTTPKVDAFAGGAVLFEHATAQTSWTLPSIASLLTGLYPTRHGAVNVTAPLPQWRRTLAEILQEAGYRTAAVVSNTLVSSKYGLEQGFDEFDESRLAGYLDVTSASVSDRAVQWLKKNREGPFFLFLHYYDPHHAYLPHEEFPFAAPYSGWLDPRTPLESVRRTLWRVGPQDVAFLEALYDGEIAFTDLHVGRVLDALAATGLDRSTIVLVASDHGEAFMEHGWLGHTRDLYEETVRVPLLLRDPFRPEWPARVAAPVELIDVMPTLLERLGLSDRLPGVDGESFLAVLEGHGVPDSLVFSEKCMMPLDLRVDRGGPDRSAREPYHDLRAVRAGRWKAVYNVFDRTFEIYDLATDPGETRDLSGTLVGPQARALRSRLLDWIEEVEETALAEGAGAEPPAPLDPQTAEQLKALGYLQ